ncbi:ADP-ribosylglycohydrolase family protein [bacterium]|nr:ADP-ribosylglycohydrolase family protein [bacterium]
MKCFAETEHRMESAALGMLLGHQMGQWSERKWWNFSQDDKSGNGLSVENLLNPEWIGPVLQEPPTITTPGWGPTGYGDLVPYICALGMEYVRQSGPLSPELFRDFLLREREWLRPQAVGRTCLELMTEGMNPRIAGLYAPSVLSGCWIAWPIAFYHAGYPHHAYEDAVLLARTQGSGDGVILTGLIAAMLAEALRPDSTWTDMRAALLTMADKRDTRIAELVRRALEIGRQAVNDAELMAMVRGPNFRRELSKYNVDWLADFYAAVAGMEFFAVHSADVVYLMCSVLQGCDSRFGSMIMLSLLAAIYGDENLPTVWREQMGELHKECLSEWVMNSANLLQTKLQNEVRIAEEILPLIHGSEKESVLYDKILAGLLAGAIGNTMGSPVEDRDYPWIVEHFGVLDRILTPGRLETEDDAAMTKIWAETYIQCDGRAYVEDLSETFRQKLVRSNYYYDTQHAYDLILQDIPPHACGHWNIVTGSAMMGCSPCGMYHAGDPRQAAADALELSYLYQRGFDVYATAIMCAAVAEALRPNATVETVLETAIAAAPADPVVYFNRHEPRDAQEHLQNALAAAEGCPDVLAAREILYAGFLEYNGQDPWEVITFTLAIFKVARGDVWQCMLGGANIGRDSDTIANLSAVLAACLHGTASIPQHLLSLFGETVLEEYQGLAQELTDAVHVRCKRVIETACRLGVKSSLEEL